MPLSDFMEASASMGVLRTRGGVPRSRGGQRIHRVRGDHCGTYRNWRGIPRWRRPRGMCRVIRRRSASWWIWADEGAFGLCDRRVVDQQWCWWSWGHHHLLGHCRALEGVAPGGRQLLDRGKARVNRAEETRGLQSISATNSVALLGIRLKM